MRFRNGAALLFIPLILCGCWDKLELNDRAYVNAMAIDKPPQKSESESPVTGEGRFAASIAISDLMAYEGNESGGENEENNKSVKETTGATVSSAIRASEANSSQKLFFGHTKAVFFGKELLADRQLFMEALDSLERDKELSRKTIVLAADGKASEVIGAKPQGEPSIGVFAENFFKRNDCGTTFGMTLADLFISLRSGGSAVLPRIKEENGKLEIGGAAVIKDYSLSGFIDEETTRGYLWQNGSISGTRVVVRYNGVSIPFTALSHKKSISFSELDGAPVMEVRVGVTGSVDEYIFENELYDDSRLREIESLVEKQIEAEIARTNRVLRDKLHTDAMNVNGMMKKKNYELWEHFNRNPFENIIFSEKAAVKIKSTGLIK